MLDQKVAGLLNEQVNKDSIPLICILIFQISIRAALWMDMPTGMRSRPEKRWIMQ